jgi:hypothetical protein
VAFRREKRTGAVLEEAALQRTPLRIHSAFLRGVYGRISHGVFQIVWMVSLGAASVR